MPNTEQRPPVRKDKATAATDELFGWKAATALSLVIALVSLGIAISGAGGRTDRSSSAAQGCEERITALEKKLREQQAIGMTGVAKTRFLDRGE